MPKVSVIMGVYNCENTLQEALDSLYTQSFQDFNIIICDDGSQDNTYKIAQENKKKYFEKIILIRNTSNLGLNITLNNCLKYADGEYIARMDADDLSLSKRFEKQVCFLDKHPEYAFVSSSMIYFDEKGDYGSNIVKEYPEKMDFVYGNLFCHAPVMIRKYAYDFVKGYSEEKKTMRVEDLDLWFKLYANGFKGYNICEPLYKMRDDKNAYSRRNFKYRLNSTYVRLKGYRSLKISHKYDIYAFKPILIGLLPTFLYNKFHKKRSKLLKFYL